MGFISYIYLLNFPLSQLNTAFHITFQLHIILRPQTQQPLHHVSFIILMLINPNNAIIHTVDFQILLQLKTQHLDFLIKFTQTGIRRVLIHDLNQGTVQTVEHQPKVREVTALVLALRKY